MSNKNHDLITWPLYHLPPISSHTLPSPSHLLGPHTEVDTPTPDTVKSVGGGVVGRQWVWLLDVERACGLVVGRCLEGMLLGPPLTPSELRSKDWLSLQLFSCGLAGEVRCPGEYVEAIPPTSLSPPSLSLPTLSLSLFLSPAQGIALTAAVSLWCPSSSSLCLLVPLSFSPLRMSRCCRRPGR